jgi:IS30 family transposase
MRDMIAKGRMAVGEQLPQAKLTEADVVEIRRLAATLSNTAIAKRYGVLPGAISRVVARKRWAHVP